MSYSPSAAGQAFKEQALVKVLVYYTDGNKRTWHGRHEASNYVPADPRELAIIRLRKYVASVAAKVRVAILYDMVTGCEISRFKEGSWS